MVSEVASRCLSECPLPSSCSDPYLPSTYTLSSMLFPLSLICLFFFFPSPLQPGRQNNRSGPSCAAGCTYRPAGIHCLQLVPSHVSDSMRTRVCAKSWVRFCRLARVCQGENVCTHLSINTFSSLQLYDQQKISKLGGGGRGGGWGGGTMEGHGSDQVRLLRTIHQYAAQVLERAQ